MSGNTWPVYTVEVAWDGSTYQTMTGVRAVAIQRGRQDELQQVQAGAATLLMDNADGRFSPLNTGSPYAPHVLPMRPLRVSAVWASTTYRLFTGYIESIMPVDNSAVDADVTIVATDWFKQATQALVTHSFAAAMEGTRIADVIAQVGAGIAPSAIDPGVEALLATTLTDTAGLQHIQDALVVERGIFFVAADGTLTYHDRHHRFEHSRSTTSQGTFAQVDSGTGQYDAGAFPFTTMDFILDDLYVYNDVRVNASGTTEGEQAASDATSQTTYGRRTLKIDSALMQAGIAASLAQWLVEVYKDAHPRLRGIAIDGDAEGTFPGLWANALGREISDRITIQKHAPGSFGLAGDYFIEAVRHDIAVDLGGHTITWLLSAVPTLSTAPFLLDTDTLDGPKGLQY